MADKIIDVIANLDVVLVAWSGDGNLARVRLNGGAEEPVGDGGYRVYLGTGGELGAGNGVAVDAVVLKTSPAPMGSLSMRIEQRSRSAGAAPGEGTLILEDAFSDPIAFPPSHEARVSTTLWFVL